MGPATRSALFVLAVHAPLVGLLPWALAEAGPEPFPMPRVPRAAWLPLLAASGGVYAWTVADFVRRGRGTPALWDPPARFVAAGAYRYSRNPMYAAMVLFVAALGLASREPCVLAYAAALGAVFHGMVVLFEEPALERRFGRAYVRYRERVPRWLPRPTKEA